MVFWFFDIAFGSLMECQKKMRPVKKLSAGMVICLERGADLHTAQLMPLPLAVSWFSKIQIGFTCLVPVNLGSPLLDKGPLNGRVCACVSEDASCMYDYKLSQTDPAEID